MTDPAPPRVADPADLQRRRAAIASRLFGPRTRDAAQIGRYTVLRRLGAGGMAVVYAAFDESLGRRVALKLLHGSSTEGNAKRQARLAREAKAMARLSHNNVATVYETGTHTGPDGVTHTFIAMEFVDGENLRRWLQAPRTTTEVLAALDQAGRGLLAAHNAGLVHRDFKPDNVMVRTDSVVKVLDFGVAAYREADDLSLRRKGARQASAESPQITATVGVAGTPAYMAPEQLRGESADARSDQYSFCVTAYEALTGRRPFEGASVEEMLSAMRSGVANVAELPRPVFEALRRGLSYEPDARFEAMPALLREISPASLGRRGRHRAGAAVAIGVLGMGGAAIWGAWERPTSRCTAADSELEATWNQEVAAKLATRFESAETPGFLRGTWARVEQRLDATAAAHRDARARLCRNAGPEALTASAEAACLVATRERLAATIEGLLEADRKGLEHAVDVAAAMPDPGQCLVAPDDVVVDGADLPTAFVRAIARARVHLGTADLAGARAAANQAIAAAADHPRGQASAHQLAAEIEAEAAEYDRAKAHLRDAAEIATAKGAGDVRSRLTVTRLAVMLAERSPDAAGFAAGATAALPPGGLRPGVEAQLARLRATVALEAGDLEAATRGAESAVALGENLPPHDRGDALDLLARVHLAAARYDVALEVAAGALDLRRETYGDRHPEVARSLGTLGAIGLRTGKWQQAKDQLAAAAEIYRAAYGPDHPEVARTRANLGSALRELADTAGALREYGAARGVFEQIHGNEDPRVAAILLNESALRHEAGEFEAAHAGYTRALQIQSQRLAPEHPHILATRANLGQLQADLGQRGPAATSLSTVLEQREASLGPDHSDVARAALELGHVRLADGKVDAATDLYRRALSIDETAFGDEHLQVAEDLAALTTALRRLHAEAEAETTAARVRKIVASAEAASARAADKRAYLEHLRRAGSAPARAALLAERIKLLTP